MKIVNVVYAVELKAPNMVNPLKQSRELEMAMFSFLARPANIPFAVPQQDLHYVFAYTQEEAEAIIEKQYPPRQAVIDLMGKTPLSILVRQISHEVDISQFAFASDKELEIQLKVVEGMIKSASKLTSNTLEKNILIKALTQIKTLITPHVPIPTPSLPESTKITTNPTVPGSNPVPTIGNNP